MEVKLMYKLSEAGQKKAILNGDSGEAERVFVLSLEKKELEKVFDLFCINTDGSIQDLWIRGEKGKFDSIQTNKEIRTVLSLMQKKLTEKKEEYRKETEERKKEVEENEKRQKFLKKFMEENVDLKFEKSILRGKDPTTWKKIAQEEHVKQQNILLNAEKWKTEKNIWIKKYGSTRLKKCVARGYQHNTLYVLERGKMDLPGYFFDSHMKYEWDYRICPSEKSLNEVEKIEKQSAVTSARVVFVKSDGEDMIEEEAVHVEFLGDYDFYRYI